MKSSEWLRTIESRWQARERRPRPRYGSLTDWARHVARGVIDPVARFLAGLGIHPNTITLLGFALSVGVGGLLAAGRLTLGGWLLLVVAPIDAFDGALARFTGKKSRFGAFLDSTLDRLSDVALLAGLLVHFLSAAATTEVLLCLFAIVGGLMVSYTRARSEALGIDCKVGLFTRLERMVVLIVGLIAGWPTMTLWVLAVGTNLTALQRILHVYAASRDDPPVA
ncbi:MAG: CDP-alcohol phosphatidyltransferase family protein [Anaerolineae bacterium]|nr:CDP-alcohol phosphatidyltransferase family protein [Anaerolineae bacterium]